jgi:pimeloyl-ACP methyl ester carboxylesterase
MHAMHKTLVLGCLAALLLAVGRAQAADAPPAPCRLRGIAHEALCGSVTRLLDPAQPDGKRIVVHYAVLPAVARNKRPDPVLLFAGGPGQSAIAIAPVFAARLERLRNRRDLVLIDQRGTGLSAPLKCDPPDPWRPLAELIDATHLRAELAACRAALERLPHGDLRQYTTTIAMADADAVRAHLGAERVNLVGGSYGTRAALEYQRQFPQRVRRAVIDGVAPPDMVLPATFSRDNQAVLDALFDACASDAACQVRHPALRSRWRAWAATLPREVTAAHPLSGRGERLTLDADTLTHLLRGPLYAPALAAALPAAMDAAIGGRLEPLLGLASALAGGGRRGGDEMAQGMHFSVVCAEDWPRLDTAADTPGADIGRGFEKLYREVCAGWPRGAVPDAFYTLPPAAAPVLVLSGGLDPVTPPRHGERVARALGAQARHVVVPNAGHGVLGIGCMSDVVHRFIDAPTDAEALRVDAACVQAIPRPPLFAPPGAGAAR